MTAPEAIVRVDGVTFRYPGDGEKVLENITFDVHPHDFIGLIGPNGGGKTTLLKILLGLLEPQAGRVVVLGRPPREVSARVGYVPQQAHVDPEAPANVEDVVLTGRLGRSAWGLRYGRADHEAARRAMARVEMLPLARRRIGELSGGQRQRVLIARALAAEPALLLLDEPMAGVDVHMERGLIDLLKDLLDQIPVVMVSHDVGFVSAHVGRVGCLNRRLSMHAPNEITERVIADMYRDLGPVQQLGHTASCPFTLEGHPHEHRSR